MPDPSNDGPRADRDHDSGATRPPVPPATDTRDQGQGDAGDANLSFDATAEDGDRWSDEDGANTLRRSVSRDPAAELPPNDVADWDLEDTNWTAPPPPPPPPPPNQAVEFMGQFQQLFRQGQRLWGRLLAGVRSRLPITAAWPDSLIGGLLVGSLVLLLTLANGLQGSPRTATPPADPAPAPAANAPAANGPMSETSAIASPEVIGDIQTQLMDAAALYGEALVQSVEVNLPRSRLTVTLSPDWFRLDREAQTALADDLQQRTARLDFNTLAVRSPDNLLLARSPVVGNAMVILQRQPLPDVPQPDRPRYRLTLD
jgi:hypothetical protein